MVTSAEFFEAMRTHAGHQIVVGYLHKLHPEVFARAGEGEPKKQSYVPVENVRDAADFPDKFK